MQGTKTKAGVCVNVSCILLQRQVCGLFHLQLIKYLACALDNARTHTPQFTDVETVLQREIQKQIS